jgi:hypothetical protein
VGEERDAEALLHHLLRRVDVVQLHHAFRLDAGAAEERIRQLRVARSAVEQDELLLGHLVEADRSVSREPVPRVGDENQPVLVERRRRDVGVSQRPHQAQVDVLAKDELQDLLGVSRLHADADARVGDGEALQDRGEHVRGNRGGRAQGEPSRAAALVRVHDPPPVRQAVERLDGVGKEHLARLGQPHAAGRAREELGVELVLQPLQAGRQRRLGHVERVCGAAHVARPCHLDECLDL